MDGAGMCEIPTGAMATFGARSSCNSSLSALLASSARWSRYHLGGDCGTTCSSEKWTLDPSPPSSLLRCRRAAKSVGTRRRHESSPGKPGTSCLGSSRFGDRRSCVRLHWGLRGSPSWSQGLFSNSSLMPSRLRGLLRTGESCRKDSSNDLHLAGDFSSSRSSQLVRSLKGLRILRLVVSSLVSRRLCICVAVGACRARREAFEAFEAFAGAATEEP
mmetsp:Transcript_40867/g.89427  ORF Transcript_40867/g.89427 Transcript_40867/m.89427 type:complete len:217 (-) Transcript_40867:1976-2626(-)